MANAVLQAALCEIERGLFHASYSIGPINAVRLPMYQLATCAAEAKNSIERIVRDQGYETIIWTDTLITPAASAVVGDRVA